ncbi:tRNA (adenosine(37)-N6)-threonylcarbamoyltransferase complex dimerization subunit type 1 TsaB [Roseomonas stagni]|uniref:tRNA (Adenosine(37)-N6)-threonylcarbamoyltransferase complex dimerization subunit type 1 TsaB n=1 Tax=Falsiroseomonas algicola TaxID=2716930 RepID=A0A6M1LWM9_9PROT|nr:tRNA (adenosine(37)-N6)-threonylcarbamoyltransferase complex dimerization subunit type 1 TsaB [Falsiroseomonas algicola]NGM23884.1 tRNA (adenosine(37)-N6)-threonylcarbamoyltransferase complex dimerization subunit type 1 TsaB [Falsiroseomonas algicola]
MRLLVLDGSLARCSAALFQDGALVAQAAQAGARGQPTALPPLAEQVLAGARPDAVAVVVGPGGFTGLRTAIALAEGIALATAARLVGVTTGEALAAALPEALREARAVWAAIDTKRGRFLLERLDAGTPPEPMAERDIPAPPGPVALVGDAAPLAAARLLARGFDAMLTDSRLPSAAAAGLVALRRLTGDIPWRDATPLYVEPPAVRLPAA